MNQISFRLRYILVLASLALVGLFPPAVLADGPAWIGSNPGNQQSPPQKTRTFLPRLEPALSQVHASYLSDGPGGASVLAQRYGIQLSGLQALVIVEALPGRVDEAAAAIEALGAREETRNGRLIQVKAPLGILGSMAELKPVSYVRRPFVVRRPVVGEQGGLPHPLEEGAVATDPAYLNDLAPVVVSEGVQRIGADAWQKAGITGQDVKIAVIDGGFFGYQSLLGTNLPPTVSTRSFRADGDLTPPGEDHGTACAEIVFDVAPGAQLFLLNFGTEVEWANAVDYAIAQGVDVVSSSIGFLPGPLDGTGFISGKVTTARSAGIFWAQSAGNFGFTHWEGNFTDQDNDAFNDFAPGERFDTFTLPAGSALDVILSWNDWPVSDQDYDMFLFILDNGEWVQVDSSTNVQSGTQPPVEGISGSSPAGGTFGIAIRRFSATLDVQFQLFTSELPLPGLQFRVAASSLAMPADSQGAVTAGATNVVSDQLEPFSSQGPTLDGRVKPDLVAPDGVSTVTYGSQNFFGTSAASPHLAGAAGLVKSVNRTAGPVQLQSFLEQNAVDMGPPGKDDMFGAGRLNLPPPATGAPGLPPPSPAPGNSVDAKVEIVFPHDAAGNPTSITAGPLVNIGAFLFSSGSLNPVGCDFGQPVRLFRALNNGVAEQVGTGVSSVVARDGKNIPQWEFKNVDVSGETNPLNKYYFYLGVDGTAVSPNVWSHGADARTIFPVQDVPLSTVAVTSTVDAKIEAVFPHDTAGNPRSVQEAELVNIAVEIFAPGTLVSVSPETTLNVRLFRSLNNGTQEAVAVGTKDVVTRSGVSHPVWLFNDVDVAAAKTVANKYYFRVVVDGVNTRSNVWSHGADARTLFPVQDVPASGCQ